MFEYNDCKKLTARLTAVVLLFASPFALPLAFGKLFFGEIPLFGEVVGVNFALYGLLALGVLGGDAGKLSVLSRSSRFLRIFAVVAGFGVILSLVQQFLYGRNLSAFFYAIAIFILPLSGLLLARDLRRMLPLFFLILFLLSSGITLREWSMGKFAVGLAGNWNWNWSLLAVSAPALVFFLPFRRYRVSVGAIIALFVGVGQFVWGGQYASRGTLISCIIATLWLVFAAYLHRKPKIRPWIARFAIILSIALGAVVYYGVRSGDFSRHLPGENRLMLYEGAIKLGESNFWCGVAPDRFEGEIPHFLPESYYDSDYATDRHPHAHNELLYLWCSFGVVGVVWFILIACAGIRAAILRRCSDERILLALWAWSVLFLHGEVDVLLQTPLSGGIFLLLTGVLLGVGIPQKKDYPVGRCNRLLAGGFFIAAFGLLILNLSSSWHCRNGKLALLDGDILEAHKELQQSVSILPTAENLYTLAAVELFNFKNPANAETALRQINTQLRLSSYSHSAGRLARSLAAQGKLQESLPFFEQESLNFPRSAVNLFLWQSVLRELGRRQEADALQNRCTSLLKSKDVRPHEFIYLMQNQELDDSPLQLRNFLQRIRQ
ncbi:MAG: O-antigen ligase family protein [Victivallales bacterium]|jgi:hypothetical protein|nr:O-antigen ligase family protein [Victivallales bacterium]